MKQPIGLAVSALTTTGRPIASRSGSATNCGMARKTGGTRWHASRMAPAETAVTP
ncbi:MAG TPA: hypothetical protein VFY43_01195 [Candidatus Limnocylindria bacterium]|nr:hypothetical protein [Candidatus Limnocylindria bacterium]